MKKKTVKRFSGTQSTETHHQNQTVFFSCLEAISTNRSTHDDPVNFSRSSLFQSPGQDLNFQVFRYLEVDGVDQNQYCGGVQRPLWKCVLDPVLCLVGNPVIDGLPCFLRVVLQHRTSLISGPAVRCLSLQRAVTLP